MIGFAAAAVFAAPMLAPPLPWASGFAPDGSWAYVADVDGDGYADLIRVQPTGDAFIDVSINISGMKAGHPTRALSNWGKDCQAAAAGYLEDPKLAEVVGIFDGDTLRLMKCDANDKFTDVPNWFKLPVKLKHPHLAVVDASVLAWDEGSGQGFEIDGAKKASKPLDVPKGSESIQPRVSLTGQTGKDWVFEFKDGAIRHGAPGQNPKLETLGRVDKGQNALVADDKVYLDSKEKGAPTWVFVRPTSKLPPAPSIWAAGDVDDDGDQDLFQFRFGKEPHTNNDVLMYRTISPGEVDSDHDGLSNDEEVKLGTDPFNPDTDGDGLLDGWEVNGFRGLDLKAMGCDPRKTDVICLISRFNDVDEKFVKDSFVKIVDYYKSLPIKNADGSTGWNLHPIFLPAVTGDDMKKPWWENRDRLLPSKWKGVVHWMQITRGGGGQADELGDGGGCGGGGMALYATFIHEFGHQLGLSHNGFYDVDGCPTYPSLMNYPYSYTLNGDIKNVSYSDGRLAKYVLNEADLDETIPLPYDKVKFLANAPYRFHLKPNGATTLIDWNWDGVFGEHHVKADVKYAYSTTAGRRDNVDKTQVAPFIVTNRGKAYVLFAHDTRKADPKVDPTLGPEKPGALYIRRLIKPFQWAPDKTIDYWGVIGDPVAASYRGTIVVAYQTKDGVVVRDVTDLGSTYDTGTAVVVNKNRALIPTIGEYDGKLWLFLWDSATETETYQIIRGGKGDPQTLADKSTVPVGPCVDTVKHQLLLGLAQDQDDKRKTRWQIRRYVLKGGKLVDVGMDWVEGVKGTAEGRSRPTVLFDPDKSQGPDGRIYYFTLGDHGKQNPWSCAYLAETVADKTATGGHVMGGWLVKRFYDEWTQSRSTPTAAFYDGDILYAYRWVDGGQGESDNEINLGYKGTGIENTPMGDFDDLTYMHDFGIRHSLMYLNKG